MRRHHGCAGAVGGCSRAGLSPLSGPFRASPSSPPPAAPHLVEQRLDERVAERVGKVVVAVDGCVGLGVGKGDGAGRELVGEHAHRVPVAREAVGLTPVLGPADLEGAGGGAGRGGRCGTKGVSSNTGEEGGMQEGAVRHGRAGGGGGLAEHPRKAGGRVLLTSGAM